MNIINADTAWRQADKAAQRHRRLQTESSMMDMAKKIRAPMLLQGDYKAEAQAERVKG